MIREAHLAQPHHRSAVHQRQKKNKPQDEVPDLIDVSWGAPTPTPHLHTLPHSAPTSTCSTSPLSSNSTCSSSMILPVPKSVFRSALPSFALIAQSTEGHRALPVLAPRCMYQGCPDQLRAQEPAPASSRDCTHPGDRSSCLGRQMASDYVLHLPAKNSSRDETLTPFADGQ